VKIFNPGNDPVVIPKGKIISKFTELNKDYDIRRINPDEKQVNFVQNVVLPKSVDGEGHVNSTANLAVKFQTFTRNFELNENLNTEQNTRMLEFLYQNRDIFASEDNPSLGCSDLEQHHIILKQNCRPLHQAPYRLSPNKSWVLQLDHFLDLKFSQEQLYC
jgi:hypothetical protein